MKFQRGFTRFVAVLTTVSLLFPTAILAFSGAAQAASSSLSGIEAGPEAHSARPAIITLQAQDLLGLLNGEVGGIPQFGLKTDIGFNAWSPAPLSPSLMAGSHDMAARVGAVMEARVDERYEAAPTSAAAAIGHPDVALLGNAATEILLKASSQASESLKLTSAASLPSLIKTPMQGMETRAESLTIKNILEGAPAASSEPAASKTAAPSPAHRFGTVLSGLKPSVDAAPFGRGWATVVFGTFASETVSRDWGASEPIFASAAPTWLALWLESMIGLAGLAALSRARRGDSARNAVLVFLKREQRE